MMSSPKKKFALKRRRRLFAEPLEARRVLAASLGWDGPGLGTAELTYTISAAPESLPQAEVDAAIESALNAWAAVADVSFTKVEQTGLRDSIDISFVNLDGTGGTLAQAYLPDDVNPARIAGDIQFDLAESWEIGNDLGSAAFDLTWVAAHEIGHALGLDHAEFGGAVLNAFVSPNQQFVGLDADDVASILELYAPASDAGDDMTGDGDSVDGEPGQEDDGQDSDEQNPDAHQHRRGKRFRKADQPDDGESHQHNSHQHNANQPTDTNEDGSTSLRDALMVINRLGPIATSEAGRCDVNNDGSISSIDALMIINSIGQSEAESSEDDGLETDSDSAEPDDDTAEMDGGSSNDDVSNDEDDDTPSDRIDDGGMIDGEGDDDADQELDEQEHRHRHHKRHRSGGRMLGNNGDQLLSRFDADQDDVLVEDEVPMGIWERLIDSGFDLDEDGTISREELETRAAEKFAERFAEQDANQDGSLTEDEVSSGIWRKLSAADSDEDGAVSLDEFETWVSERNAENPMPNSSAIDHGCADQVFAEVGRRLRLRRR